MINMYITHTCIYTYIHIYIYIYLTYTYINMCICILRWGWVFLERSLILSRFQFTRQSIGSVLVETNQFVVSNPHVILTRYTCSQRLGRAAGSKRRTLAFYFSIRIYHVFLISKCRRELDPGLCTTLGLEKECCCTVATSD